MLTLVKDGSVNYSEPDEEVATKKYPIIKRRWVRYLTLFLLSVILVWAPVVAYDKYVPESYQSMFSILIPGSGVGSSVNLENLGQTTTSIASPYSSNSVDPKANYKEIAMSIRVRRNAADRAGVALDEYPKPKIKLIDQTSLMKVVFDGASKNEAFQFSNSLLAALQEELNKLRRTERERIQEGNLDQLKEYEKKVEDAKSAIVQFQSESEIVSVSQLELDLENLDELKKTLDQTQTKRNSLVARIQAQSNAVGLNAQESADVVKLQQDKLLQNQQEQYFGLLSNYHETSAVLGDRHPKVALAKSKVTRARQQILVRSKKLVGEETDATFMDVFMSSQATGGVNLYQDLTQAQIELQATKAELIHLDSLVQAARTKVSLSTTEASKLRELERRLQVANTIYLSAIAKLDLGRSDFYASYPMIQVLVEPTVPNNPEALQRIFAVIGAALGTVLIILSLVLLWKRYELVQKISKKK